jgi:hypothetical protein
MSSGQIIFMKNIIRKSKNFIQCLQEKECTETIKDLGKKGKRKSF